MSIGRLFNQPLTVYPAVLGVDEYGNQTRTVGEPVAELGLLQQQTSTEYLTNRDTTVTLWKAYLQPTTTAGHLSVIDFDGQRFQVTGEPDRKWNPRLAAVSHVEAVLTAMT